MENNQSRKTWCITLNNWTADEYQKLKDLRDVSYAIYGKEMGESNTPHIQGCITWFQSIRFNAVRALIPRAHISSVATNVGTARKYCKKDGNFEEVDNRDQGKRTDLDDAVDCLKEFGIEQLMDEHSSTFIKYPGGFRAMAAHLRPQRDYNQPPVVTWVYGPTGTGKTRWVYDHYSATDIWCSTGNMQWWDGYNQQQVLLLDDFRGSDMKFSHFLRITDRYPYQVEFKGGMVHINSRNIIITSNKSPEDTYAGVDDEQMDQLIRRCTNIIHMEESDVRVYIKGGAPVEMPNTQQVVEETDDEFDDELIMAAANDIMDMTSPNKKQKQ